MPTLHSPPAAAAVALIVEVETQRLGAGNQRPSQAPAVRTQIVEEAAHSVERNAGSPAAQQDVQPGKHQTPSLIYQRLVLVMI